MQPIENNTYECFKFSNDIPEDIAHIYCIYSAFYVFLKDKSYTSANSPFVWKKDINKMILIGTQQLKWSQEHHQYFPPAFQEIVFAFFLAMKRRNSEKESSISRIPKVLLVEITKALAGNYN